MTTLFKTACSIIPGDSIAVDDECANAGDLAVTVEMEGVISVVVLKPRQQVLMARALTANSINALAADDSCLVSQ